MLPHGKGKYAWSDGTVYEGDWEEGKMTGKGKIFWPSQVTYEGDFSGGYLHGFGTFIDSDGSIYKGSLKMNSQHGIGRKEYPNSDVYDGCWREGVREGSGRYVWSNGNIYIGTWKNGKMSGRGVMKWSNGDLFDGFWSNGLRHGSGFYRFTDGSYYFGTWTKGLKDGPGTFYPAGSKHLNESNLQGREDKRKKQPSRSSSMDSEESVIPNVKRSLSEKISSSFRRGSRRFSHKTTSLDDDWDSSSSVREMMSRERSCVLSQSFRDVQNEFPDNETVAYEREYMQGVLIKERIRNISKLSHKTKQQLKFAKEVKRSSWVDIFEGQRSYYLRLSLQLGIRQLALDSAFLESQQIIDYSLLLGLHFSAPEHLKSLLEPPDSLHKAESTSASVDGVISGDLLIRPTSLLLVTHEPGPVSPTPGPHIRGSTLKAFSIGNKEADLLLPGTGR
ncbi:UNVERIFIED_CONTAM: Phosphatidylinositol 4-phosphate 5-kinase [Sesamum radiatum]|uniref:Phosphatidylinositol 4-phosphate 5-kinase n=1 Tax=Sesamum radiatum TaxID=300843 RepID=A0AAW2U6Q6_SESRA